jgi:hypothetical protein
VPDEMIEEDCLGKRWETPPAANRTDEWYTPQWVLDPLGDFSLDPCAGPARQFAHRNVTPPENGLAGEWKGRVWLNPPYSDISTWMARMADHGFGTALTFARTDVRWFHASVFAKATGILFLKGRVRFEAADGTTGGSPPSPSCLIAYGAWDAKELRYSGLEGHYVEV